MALRLVISTDNDDNQMHPFTALRLGAPTMALHVNRPIPISLYFCFLSRMVVGLIEDPPG
jgi:hypothetical protein